jgi:flagellar biogenesis protein FliO
MEPNVQNSSGMMNGIPPVPQTNKKLGPVIGALVIVLILIIASIWFFGKNTTPASDENNQDTVLRNEAGLSNSTNEADINADLDAQLQDVDYSF